MAKKTVYICDTQDCGAVLVNPQDGFVLTGSVKSTAVTEDPKILLPIPTDGQELSLCRECMAKALGFHHP
jgi:vacuolar-type H+-ATPase subunit F/Vma7